MLGRLTCILAAGMGFVAGYLLATAVAPVPPPHARGRVSQVVPLPPRQATRAAKSPSGRRSAATDGQRHSRKPSKGKAKSSRPKKNP